MKKITTLLILTMILAAGPAWAINAPVDEGMAKLADHQAYAVKVPGMIAHGLYEIAEAPLEMLNQPYEETIPKGDYAFGILKGINNGAYNLFEGITRGLFNIVRAVVPGVGRYEKTENQRKILPDFSG